MVMEDKDSLQILINVIVRVKFQIVPSIKFAPLTISPERHQEVIAIGFALVPHGLVFVDPITGGHLIFALIIKSVVSDYV